MLKALLRIFGKDDTEAEGLPYEKRRSPRISYYIPCEVYDHVRFQTKAKSLIRNISFHGVCLDTEFPVRVGDEFSVSFSLSGSRFEMVKAKVVWSVKIPTGYRCGLAFEDRWVKDIKKAVLQLMSNEG